MLDEPVVIVEPLLEPITPEELRGQLKMDVRDAAQDNLLDIYISCARDYVEWRTGWTFHQKTLLWVLDYWPYYNSSAYASTWGRTKLPGATPLIGIDFIKYKGSDGVDNVWDPSQYVADTLSTPGGFKPGYGVAFPFMIPYPVNPIRIQYRAGIATASPAAVAPAKIKEPVLLLAAALFENRESESLPDRSAVKFVTREVAGFEGMIKRFQGSHAF